jgi:hypothetical protein
LPKSTPRSHRAWIAVVCAVALVVGCAPANLAAHWRDRQIEVDGRLDEWTDMQTDLAAGRQNPPARVGFANDGEALYLSLQTADPNLQQLIAHRGLTVWFDPAGGRQRVAGVRFPRPSSRPPSHGGEIGASRPSGSQLTSLELLGPQPYTRRELSSPGGDGVEVAIGFGERGMAYELRVPLAAAPPAWGLGVKTGALLGVGVQSKGIGDAGDRLPPRGEGGGPAEEGPAAGPGGPGPGGRGPRPSALPDFELWAAVRLATPPG